MANKNHLEMLKKGVEHWNTWRGKNPGMEPDLREADLNGAELFDANLSDANLSVAKLINADLSGANLYYTNFNDTDLRKVKLGGTQLEETVFANILFKNTKGLEAGIHHGPSISVCG